MGFRGVRCKEVPPGMFLQVLSGELFTGRNVRECEVLRDWLPLYLSSLFFIPSFFSSLFLTFHLILDIFPAFFLAILLSCYVSISVS